VVGIVQPDADELADAGDARPEPRRALDQRQGGDVDRAEALDRRRRERVAGNIVDMGFERADPSSGIQETGLFLPARAVTQQFHGCRLSVEWKPVSVRHIDQPPSMMWIWPVV
jgi:hypothetical protein